MRDFKQFEKDSLDTLFKVRQGVLLPEHGICLLKELFINFDCRTVSEEAKRLKVERQTVYNRIGSGKIEAMKLKNQTFVIN